MAPARILLVEDDPAQREMYAAALTHAGFEVLPCWNGEDAIRLARSEKPDLAIIDIHLPSISGHTVVSVLRWSWTTNKMPILGMSADLDARDEACSVGCHGFLVKPLEPRMLIEEVNRLTGRP